MKIKLRIIILSNNSLYMKYKVYSYMAVQFISMKRICVKYKVYSYMNIHFTYKNSIGGKKRLRIIDTEFTENIRSVICLYLIPSALERDR